MSISRIASHVAPKEAKNANKTVVVVGTVTDDVRYVGKGAHFLYMQLSNDLIVSLKCQR
jgi:ribosomal protein L18E